MSGKSTGSHDGPLPSSGDILRSGVLKKMKTSRKKYFVLRAETSDALARLEYYDSEKKFRQGLPPKRSIPLKTCFNINRKQDSKHKNVIALYTKDDCFCIMFETEEELRVWLKDFLTLQHGEEIPEGEVLRPKFEYVWQANLCERGLGAGRTGLYRLCLTDKTITLAKINEAVPTVIQLSLTNIRSCGNLKNFFFLEVGRMSEVGAGEIWFETEDSDTALNIQITVSHRFRMARERNNALNQAAEPTDLQPKGRIRSASATESSKSNSKKFNPIMSAKYVPAQDSATSESTLTPSVSSSACGSSTTTTTVSGVAMSIYNHLLQRGTGKRRHSISGGGTSWSAGANHQRTQSLPLATPVTTAPATTTTITNCTADNTTTTICLTNHQPPANKKTQGAAGGGKCSFRDRCDSMPTRPPRTTSEGSHCVLNWGKPYLVPFRTHHLRDASYSPPTGSPISPPSDSTGSSYSLPDEHDGPHDMEHQRMYSTLTPDEVIAEEDYPESPKANQPEDQYVPMNFQSGPETAYVGMNVGSQYGSHNYTSNSASMSSVTSGTPSTDIRLSDYPLDKVFSYVSADDDDTRPCRAYSVGSKPPEAQLGSTPENSRVRAFSVGAKTKKGFNRVLPAHHYPPGAKSSSAPLLAPNSFIGSSHGSVNNPMDDLMEMDFTMNDPSRSKSSNYYDSRSSCNHKNSSCNNSTKGKFLNFLEHLGVSLGGDKKNNNSASDGYVVMKPGPRTVSSSVDVAPYVDMTQGQRGIPFADVDFTNNGVLAVGNGNAPYMDMSGGTNATNNVPSTGHPFSPYVDMSGKNGSGASTPHAGNDDAPYLDMSGGSTAREADDYLDMSGSSPVRNSPRSSTMGFNEQMRQLGRNNSLHLDGYRDYMDMSQRQRTNSNSSALSRAATSPGAWTGDHNSDYLDMSGRNGGGKRRSERTNSFGSQMSSSPHFDTASPKFSDMHSGSASDIKGYVQVTPGESARHQRQSSIDSTDNEYGDYMNMSGMNVALTAARVDEKGRSKPIAIQTTSGNTVGKNSSPISISSLLGRKASPTGAGSPKMHLPLSPYSSLPRQKSARKASSQAGSSKDSSLSSSVTTTPSGSSTMFPLSLNSPSSPLGGHSKTGTPTTSAMKIPASVLNVPYKAGGTGRKNSSDYTMMDFELYNKSSPLEASRVEDSPYMNYCPPGFSSRLSRLHNPDVDDYSGDYAVMKPGIFPPANPTALSRPKGSGGSSGLASPLANHLSSVGLDDRNSMCFMPIREKDERMCSPKPGDVPDKSAQDDKNLETANMEFEDESSRPYDRLKSPSSLASSTARPNSSNSDQIKSQAQRPASATDSEKNVSRPPSVCSEGLTSRLGSTSSVYSSSSSASTVVGKPDLPETDQQQIVRLHYASLDLSSTDPAEDRKSPRALKSASSEASLSEGQTATTTTTTFVYADIDFVKSDELNKIGGQSGAGVSNNGTATVKN